MKDTCCNEVCEVDNKASLPLCPKCGGKGKKIQTITVRYLVQGKFQDRVNDSLTYRFCLSRDCPVVYFSELGNSFFMKEELSERVTIKEKNDPIPVCYCFNFFRHDVEVELKETGKTTIPDFISAQVKAGNCFCEYTNPEGTCCLGNVSLVVKNFLKKEVSK